MSGFPQRRIILTLKVKLHADALLKNMYSIGTTDEELDPDGDTFY